MRACGTRELANFFDVEPITIRNWARQGSIPYFRAPDKRYRFIKEEVLNVFLRKVEENEELDSLKRANEILKAKLEKIEDILR
jgi:hypothetical protein